VHEALQFYEQLPSDTFELTIIGHCPNKPLRKYLSDKAQSLDGLHLRISREPVPHDKIVANYTTQTIGLLPYRANQSIDNKVPTKLYEYLAHGIPVLISPNQNWHKVIQKYNGGRTVDFNKPPKNDIISICNNLIKIPLPSDIKELMWINSENEFLSTIEQVLRN
jgi:glycogen(starch) synthase